MVCAHLATRAAHRTVLRDHPEDDLVGIAAAAGLSTSQVALHLTVPAVLDAVRRAAPRVPRWVPAVSVLPKALGIAETWSH